MPTLGLWKRKIYYEKIKGMQFISLLNYLDYNKVEAKQILAEKFGWIDYGGKHYESLFTKFYQAYILPTKFRIDKRRAHLSTLVCSGQIAREEALKKLQEPLYDRTEFENDKQYVLKKLGLTEKDFDEIMNRPIVKHEVYGTDEWIHSLLKPLIRLYRFFRPGKDDNLT